MMSPTSCLIGWLELQKKTKSWTMTETQTFKEVIDILHVLCKVFKEVHIGITPLETTKQQGLRQLEVRKSYYRPA